MRTVMAGSEKSIVRTEVYDVLGRLRSRIRRYVALEGIAIVVAVLGIAFWFSLATDYWLEPSVVFRQVFLALVLAATAVALVRYLLLRLVRVIRNRALALVLERRFRQLDERLITAVELTDARDDPAPLTLSMLRQTA